MVILESVKKQKESGLNELQIPVSSTVSSKQIKILKSNDINVSSLIRGLLYEFIRNENLIENISGENTP